MIEMLSAGIGLTILLLIVAIVFAVTYRQERDEARQDLGIAEGAQQILENRVTVLRGDVEAQQHMIDTLRAGHDQLVAEKRDLERENGRLKAEARAHEMSSPVQLPPNTIVQAVLRDPETGRFLPKKPKPVACG